MVKTLHKGYRHPLAGLAAPLLLLASSAQAHGLAEDYMDMPLEDLLSMEVTLASKKKQPLNEAAAAIFVIAQDDILRSGVTSIPEALRMAPGIQVGRIDANKWAVSSRGFTNQFANKLLDFWVYYVHDLEQTSYSIKMPVPSYISLNAMIAWHPVKNLEFSLVAHNLLDSHHREFVGESLFSVTEVERSIYGGIRWGF